MFSFVVQKTKTTKNNKNKRKISRFVCEMAVKSGNSENVENWKIAAKYRKFSIHLKIIALQLNMQLKFNLEISENGENVVKILIFSHTKKNGKNNKYTRILIEEI